VIIEPEVMAVKKENQGTSLTRRLSNRVGKVSAWFKTRLEGWRMLPPARRRAVWYGLSITFFLLLAGISFWWGAVTSQRPVDIEPWYREEASKGREESPSNAARKIITKPGGSEAGAQTAPESGKPVKRNEDWAPQPGSSGPGEVLATGIERSEPAPAGTGAATLQAGAGGDQNAAAGALKSTAAPGGQKVKVLDLADMTWPLAGKVTLGFGWQYSPTHSDWRYHPGLDIQSAPDAEVKAVLPGRVVAVSRDQGFGVTVIIDHGAGIQTVYANTHKALVREGDAVEQGDPVALVGPSATMEVGQGPHLHFEVRVDGRSLDPNQYLD